MYVPFQSKKFKTIAFSFIFKYIFLGELPFNELLGSEASSVDTLDANDSSNLLDYDNDDDDIEDNKLSMSVMSLSKISYSKPEKYILKKFVKSNNLEHIIFYN